MEWLRWLITIVVVVLAYREGVNSGQNAAQTTFQVGTLASKDGTINELQKQLKDREKKDAEAQVAEADLVAAITKMEQRFGGIGAQMRSALNASNLAVCVYPDDVRRVRNDARAESRAAAERVNAAAERASSGQ